MQEAAFWPELNNCIPVIYICGTGTLYAQLARRIYSLAVEIADSI